ncbi:MAG: PAS domain S-box protein, partial [Planctomycetes bacterium]|nr:PAS domain S-box protein [Planctomycetota bacterium]
MKTDPAESSDELYRLVVENLDDYAVIVLDTARRVRTWNRGAERLLGRPRAEIIGKSADVIFTPEDVAAGVPRREAEQALATGRAEDTRWHVRKDGTRFWASGVMIRLDDGPQGARGLAKVLRDQTALKLAQDERTRADEALRASELRFRRLIEANIVGVGISNGSGAWVDANDALLRTLGHTRDDLRAGRVRWDRMTPPEYRPRDERGIAEAIERGACTPYEKEYVRADGTRVPVLIGYATVSGIEEHYVCFVLDLTPQKRVERELREADRRKDEFLAMLAHELRNPLAPIRTALHVLRLPDTGPEVQERARATMERQVGAMVRLVDDLLDVSRIMQGKVELRPETLELQAVIGRAVETSRPLVDAQGHELTVSLPDQPVFVSADPVRLAQVVSNLLNNAAKYTEKGGRIWLTAAREDGHVRVSVRDTGIGIPPERLSQVFDLFMQVDPTLARSQGGLGIGLTLVKRLVEMHGGSVAVTSGGLGQGREFTVRLPVLARSGSAGAGHESAPPAGRRLKVLVVDDNVDAAETLGTLLGILGHDAEVVHTPAAALAAVGSGPDLVLLDIGLPEMSGYDVAREIRRRAGGGGPVLAAVTGYGQDQDREQGR